MGNTFGRAFRVTTFGESHGGGLGAVVDGCPPGLVLDVARIQAELDRRRPGTSALTSTRRESDHVEVLSGLHDDGRTLGTPIALLLRNEDADPAAYQALRDVYRPSHADFVYDAKYGLRAASGGGRASARETAARVAAGAVARQVLASLGRQVEVVAWVAEVRGIGSDVDPATVTTAHVDTSEIRCPDPAAAARFEDVIRAAKAAGDSVGGVIRCVARGVPAGLGEPVFDKLDADLGKALLSLPAAKGFTCGSGFAGTHDLGSVHNDPFEVGSDGAVRTRTNRSGGIQGGISNGMPIEVAVAFKPVATVQRPQDTVTAGGQNVVLEARGRHDPCVLPRAVPIVEAMVALVLADHWLRWRGQVGRP